MKILANCYGYPPHHNAGSENTMHGLLKFLQSRGHEVRVYASHNAATGEYEGVPVFAKQSHEQVNEHYRWADVAISHLHRTRYAIKHARETGRPLVHYVHNEAQLQYHKVQLEEAACVIFNTQWIADKERWPGMHCVIHPSMDGEKYRTEPAGRCVTLINLDDNKGPKIFWHCAKMLPNVPFLAVKGSYGRQVIPPIVPKNVTVLENTPRMRDDVYARTRILLMPSASESWGRVAMEAAVSGIPTLASPTPGLRECLGEAGTFIPRDDAPAWVQAIGKLLRYPQSWEKSSRMARARFEENQAGIQRQLEHFETMLPEIAALGRAMPAPYRPGEARTFYLAAYPNLRIGAPYDVRFEGGVFTTSNPEAMALLRRCYGAAGLREEVAR